MVMVIAGVYQSSITASSNTGIALLHIVRSSGEEDEDEDEAEEAREQAEDEEDEAGGKVKRTSSGDAAAAEKNTSFAEGVRSCYHATGSKAPGFWACYSAADISPCCPAGYACLSDAALCVATESGNLGDNDFDVIPRKVLLAACTGQEWSEDVCGRRRIQCPGQCFHPHGRTITVWRRKGEAGADIVEQRF